MGFRENFGVALGLFWRYNGFTMTAKNLTSARRVGRPRRNRVKTSIGVTEDAYALWIKLAEARGVTQIAALELAIRESAQTHSVSVTPEEVAQIAGKDTQ